MKCRHCQTGLEHCFIDLGSAPPSNAYLTREKLNEPEKWFPLRVMVCHKCWLVQTEDFASFNELFDDAYAYFSSYSTTWLAHAEKYSQHMIQRFGLTENSHVVEVAANDGYLLQYFKKAGISCIGIEPTASTAEAARKKDIEIIEEFFGKKLGVSIAENGRKADLTAANNVLAHVPDINDFIQGFVEILNSEGVSTFEFPSFLNLLNETQFDTIYHEHFSYLSLLSVDHILRENGLTVFDVEELPTHGGSLRVYAQRSDTGNQERTDNVDRLIEKETEAGLDTLVGYERFQRKAEALKDDFISFLIQAKIQGKTVAAYGAAAKGNTLLNFAGIRPDLISFVVDRNPAKQGKYLPGSRIPIVAEDTLKESQPDYIVILPWNLRSEIINQLDYVSAWGGRFVTAVPHIQVTP